MFVYIEQTKVGAYFKLVAGRMQIKLCPELHTCYTVRNPLNFLTTLRKTTACTQEPLLLLLYFILLLLILLYFYFKISKQFIIYTHSHTVHFAPPNTHCKHSQLVYASFYSTFLTLFTSLTKRFALYNTLSLYTIYYIYYLLACMPCSNL